MKILLTFFLLICFHLLDGQEPVSTNMFDCDDYDSADVDFTKTKAVERTGESQRCLISKHSATPGENEWSLFAEDDDEEDYIRKCRSRTDSLSIFHYSFVSSYPPRDLENRFRGYRHPLFISSSKYIAQRVLRI